MSIFMVRITSELVEIFPGKVSTVINGVVLFTGKDNEHLDWSMKMRILMGTTYCLQYLLQELNPPVTLDGLQSSDIYLTDDFAAKVHAPVLCLLFL